MVARKYARQSDKNNKVNFLNIKQFKI